MTQPTLSCSLMENYEYGFGFSAELIGAAHAQAGAFLFSLQGSKILMYRRRTLLRDTRHGDHPPEIWQSEDIASSLPGDVLPRRIAAFAAFNGILVAAATTTSTRPDDIDLYTIFIDEKGTPAPAWTKADTLPDVGDIADLTIGTTALTYGGCLVATTANAKGGISHHCYNISSPDMPYKTEEFTLPASGVVIRTAAGWHKAAPGSDKAVIYTLIRAVDGGTTLLAYYPALKFSRRLNTPSGINTMTETTEYEHGTHILLGGSRLFHYSPELLDPALNDPRPVEASDAMAGGITRIVAQLASRHTLLDSRHTLRAWTLSGGGCLSAASLLPGMPWFPARPVGKNITQIVGIAAGNGNGDIVTLENGPIAVALPAVPHPRASAGAPKAVHHWIDPITGTQVCAPIVLKNKLDSATKDSVESRTQSLQTYTVEAGAPLEWTADGPVQITIGSSQPTRLKINGSYYSVGKERQDWVTVPADLRGMVSLTGLMTTTSTPVIRVQCRVDDARWFAADVHPYSEFSERLTGVTGDRIRKAGISDSKEGADAAAQAIDQINNHQRAALSHKRAVAHGLLDATAPRLRTGESANRIVQRAYDSAIDNSASSSQRGFLFHVDLASGTFTSEPSAVAALHRQLVGDRPVLQSWFGDLFDAILNGIEALASFVVEAVDEGLEFTLRIADKVIKATVTFVEQAWAVVGRIFEAIGGFFKKIFEWLAFIFQWEDIIRTQRVAKTVLNIALRNAVWSQAKEATKNLTDVIGNAISGGPDLGPNKTFSGASDKAGENNSLSDPKTNWVSTQASHGAFDSPQTEAALRNAVIRATEHSLRNSDLVKPLKSSELDALIEQTTEILKRLGSDIWNLDLSKFVIDLVEGLGDLLKKAAYVLLDEIQSLAQSVATILLDVLNQEIDIPILSDIFTVITGQPLTMLNAATLLGSIVGTILYKIVALTSGHQRPPFTEEDASQLERSQKLEDFAGIYANLNRSAQGSLGADHAYLTLPLLSASFKVAGFACSMLTKNMENVGRSPVFWAAAAACGSIGEALWFSHTLVEAGHTLNHADNHQSLVVIECLFSFYKMLAMLFNYDGKEEALEKVILSADIVAQIVMCFIDKGKELTHAALAVGGAAELVFNACEEEYVSVRIVAAVIAVAAPLSTVLMEKREEYQPETLLVPA